MDAVLGSTGRTRLRRLPEKAVDDRTTLHAILDEALVAHVALVDGHHPFALPCGYAREGERLLLHGSTGSRLMRSLAAGVPACVTVTQAGTPAARDRMSRLPVEPCNKRRSPSRA